MQAAVASPPTFADLLNGAEAMLNAAGVSTPRLDAEVLLAAALQADRSALYARLRQTAPGDVRSTFDVLIERRRRREPVAYIVGVREFWSLPIRVTPAVLVPRPETELLVESVISLAVQGEIASVWDVGTGSGCIAVALARELPRARILATDVSPAALELARENAVALGVAQRIDFAGADLGEGLRADRSFDIVVSNPPYLAENDPVAAELAWEPARALRAGSDGLGVIRRLMRQAASRLRGGSLVMEMGFGQESAARRLAEETGFVDVSVRDDYFGIPRVLVARAPERSGRG